MRRWMILVGMLTWIGPAWAGCGTSGTGGTGGTVRDWGLRRAWAIERDCGHPERPAVLVEIPWTDSLAGNAPESDCTRGEAPANPEVRAGMRVAVVRREGRAAVQLWGTALGTGRTGERIAVRAGLGSSTLVGIVRGPGRVELEPGGAR